MDLGAQSVNDVTFLRNCVTLCSRHILIFVK